MHKCLYMICPTDYLEPVIRNRFKGGHYFLTSLGNTLRFNRDILEQIIPFIREHEINEITFILSEDNNIVKDALNEQEFQETRGLYLSYGQFVEYQKTTKQIWQSHNQQSMILSYHLNEKIKELKNGLSDYLENQLLVNGKLFSRSDNTFRYIYSDLFCINKNQLN